ncbi:MAG TPA: hypothetical protein VMU32_10935 [Solirubrobacteraceae bacterium]|nr:hypothetical protein [Solirubrobacteraceae bacterium]
MRRASPIRLPCTSVESPIGGGESSRCRARQGLGNRRPLDLVRAGRAAELLDAIAQEQAGSFA